MREGMVSQLEVLEAERSVLAAEQQLLVNKQLILSDTVELYKALGGGWPRGRFIEIYVPESGGKSTCCLPAIAEHQRKYPDEDVALIDTEYSFDEQYAIALGVNTRWLIVHQPDHESALFVRMLAVMGGPNLPVPVGVLRERELPTYEDGVDEQIAAAQEAEGIGSMAELLDGGGSWVVE